MTEALLLLLPADRDLPAVPRLGPAAGAEMTWMQAALERMGMSSAVSSAPASMTLMSNLHNSSDSTNQQQIVDELFQQLSNWSCAQIRFVWTATAGLIMCAREPP